MAEPLVRTAPRGPGTVLLVLYALFTVAAGSRSVVQLALHADRAPVAYGLSVLAAVVYTLGLVALWRVARGATTVVARAWCVVELVGVLTVGTLSLAVPSWFPEPSVWSGFGSGYGFVPTVLPLLALWWLHAVDRHRDAAVGTSPGT